MLIATISWWALCVAVSFAEIARVPVRQEATVASDVRSIEHDIFNRQFHITLNSERKCISPTFVLRISGAALYKLDLITQSSAPGLYLYGYPPLVDAGTYFLDAVILFCGTYDPNKQKELCLEDASYGKSVINDPYSFTVSAAETSADSSQQPRWKNVGEQLLVPTRYQMHSAEAQDRGLPCAAMYHQDYCITDRTVAKPYASYNWTDVRTHQWLSIAHSVKIKDSSLSGTGKAALGRPLQRSMPGKVNICLVGDSHSRELYYIAQKGFTRNRLVTFTFVPSIFPLLFSADQLDQNLCSVAVISFGQWSLSSLTDSPVTIDAFKSEMRSVFADLAAKGSSTRVFFRSENYNGLGAHVRLCPHSDFRTPPAFDALNQAVRGLCEETSGRIPFIDLGAIIGPMWDAAVDFCHPDAPVLHAEVDVILHAVFTHVRDQRLPVRAYSAVILGDTAPGRSEDPGIVETLFHTEKVSQAQRMRKIALERYGSVPAHDAVTR